MTLTYEFDAITLSAVSQFPGQWSSLSTLKMTCVSVIWVFNFIFEDMIRGFKQGVETT